MRGKRIFLVSSLLLLPTLSAANNLDIYLSVGPAFSELSNNSRVKINNTVTNGYDADQETSTAPLAGIGLGHTFVDVFQQPFSIAVGLAGYIINYDEIEGVEAPFVNGGGPFDTLNYQFSAESYIAMLESRFIYTRYTWNPFLLVGIGVSWNHLYDFEDTATNPNGSATPSPASQFDSDTQAAFAYELGVGVQHTLFEDKKLKINWSVALAYRYLSMGEGELDESPLQTADQHLKVDNLHTNAVLLTLQGSI